MGQSPSDFHASRQKFDSIGRMDDAIKKKEEPKINLWFATVT
jgi:hypothetical protein